MEFEIGFCGHANIRSLHESTIEITAEESLTPAGDCIIGVGAQCGCAGLPEGLKARLRSPSARATIVLQAGGCEAEITGRGDSRLTLADPRDIVIRKSSFACPRTLAVCCDAASDSLPREMVRALQDPQARGKMIIRA